MHELYVRTQHDEREYISVLEIFWYDEEGDEVIHQAATAACMGLVTCGDMPDRLDVLRQQVESQLRHAGIPFDDLYMDAA